MGLFKGLNDKPYTKADYYREMEERHAAKMAAKAAPVVVVPVKDPEWLEPETPAEQSVALETVEEVVIPFVEPAAVEPIAEVATVEVAEESKEETQEIVSEPVIEETKEETKKVSKQKRKKS